MLYAICRVALSALNKAEQVVERRRRGSGQPLLGEAARAIEVATLECGHGLGKLFGRHARLRLVAEPLGPGQEFWKRRLELLFVAPPTPNGTGRDRLNDLVVAGR